MLKYSPDHFSSNFKFDISKLPTRKTDRTSLIKSVLSAICGVALLALGIFEMFTFLKAEKNSGFSFFTVEIFALIVIAIAIGVIINSIFSIIRYKKFAFDGEDFEITYKPSIGIKHHEKVALSGYIGVRLRVLFTQNNLFNKNRYIIDLYHEDASKIVPLYISTNGKNIRKIWESYASAFKLPAININERGIVKRDYTDLDKSIKELSDEGKLPFIAGGKYPAPQSLKIDDDLKSTSIEPSGLYWDTFSSLFLFIAICFALVLMFGGVYLTFTGMSVPVKYWIIGALSLLASVYFSTRLFSTCRIQLNDKEIIVYNIVCGNETKKTSIYTKDIEGIELNYNTAIDRYSLTLISDEKIISFGSRIPVNDLLWLRDFITRKLIGN